jgi:hypothetical protein
VPGFKRKDKSLQQLKICDQVTHSKNHTDAFIFNFEFIYNHLFLQLFVSFCCFGLFWTVFAMSSVATDDVNRAINCLKPHECGF